jgi:uroporphyrinogen decarboxylase
LDDLRGWAAESAQQYAVVIGDPIGGILFGGIRLRGFEQFMIDLIREPAFACGLMDRVTESKMVYWESVFDALGDLVDVAVLEEDLGGQDNLLVSPEMFRKLIKPRYQRLFASMRRARAPTTRILLHSDGAILELIPDLIELGVDALNPIQTSAAGMNPKHLKAAFGDELTFWGAGVDSQTTLRKGAPDDIRREVSESVEALAPGGGYVFSVTQNLQGDIPPRNVEIMLEALSRVGVYT